jgi:hypothetical protein
MNETERRTGPQGGAYVGGKWFSAEELRAAGRRVTDGLGRNRVGICPACGASRLGTTDGPGGLQFVEGAECLHCGHLARRILHIEEGNGEAVEPFDDEDPDSF